MQPHAIPLQGWGLIEASAGTGKTYTISALYLRLLLEQALPVEQILVVTYTKAATAELKERIRSRMVEARTALQLGASEDPFLQALIDRTPSAEQAERQLTCAILSFDQAAIYTIHGFCQRALSDHAFEAGLPFELVLEPDDSTLLREIGDDFWRTRLCDLPAGLTRYLVSRGTTPQSLLKPIRQSLNKPLLEVRGQDLPDDLESLEYECGSLWSQLRKSWKRSADEVMTQLQHARLHKGSYKPDQIPAWRGLMDQLLAQKAAPAELFRQFELFTASKLAEKTNKGGQPPEHVFFVLCDEFLQLHRQREVRYQQAQVALLCGLRRYLLDELRRRKQERRLQGYDDLLHNLLQALERKRRGPALATALRERYRAALIDEFQDTDPVQYRIFSRIYADCPQPLFFVGDPKQAIYGFRGADIFAYLQARRETAQRFALDTNWRSVPGLIKSVNRLFDAEYSFLLEGLGYQPVCVADKVHEILEASGGANEPFCVQLIRSQGKPLTKEAASSIAAEAAAAEIVRLLNLAQSGQAGIGERPLSGGDIAVLVRDHRQAGLISRTLLQRGVNSVQTSQASVFETPQALELERVLLAVAKPGQEALLRAALITDLLGFSANDLAALSGDEQALGEQFAAFQDLHDAWQARGFAVLFRQLLSQRGIAARLLRFDDGERRLTNLLHLGELLQHQEQQRHPGTLGLINWLSQQRRDPPKQNDAAQLRLESDENLVQILTIHKSKGLEFPVVFCPFLWDGKLHTSQSGTSYSFHAKDKAVIDLGSDRMEQDRPQAVREEMAENLRLLYVALTRAKQRCYVGWGHIKGCEKSALGWLLHPPAEPGRIDAIASMADRYKELGDQELEQRLRGLAAELPGDMWIDVVDKIPDDRLQQRSEAAERLTARSFSRPLRSSQRVTSFSALTAGIESEAPDYDATWGEAVTPAGLPQRSIYSFPKGARAGTCLHEIFEHLDFSQHQPSQLHELVSRTLAAHGFAVEWQPVISAMVERVLDTPLDGQGRITLRRIGPGQRLNELEFCFPLAEVSGSMLRQLLQAQGFSDAPRIRRAFERLDFAPVEGYLKGFIDLVFEADGRFYVLDYKSNWLGDRLQDYASEGLAESMAEHNYCLQYLVYVVALHRYLRSCIPDYDYERHFGGVFYLFLRGMAPAHGPDYGIYRDRPDASLIEALDALFGEANGG